MTRWFYDVYNMPMYREIAGDLRLLDLPFPTLPAEEDNLTQEKKQVETRQATTTAADGDDTTQEKKQVEMRQETTAAA